MITAKEARIKSLTGTQVNAHMRNIELLIMDTIEKGAFNAVYHHCLFEKPERDHENDALVMSEILKRLGDLGYRTNSKYCEPLPMGCPCDQWNPLNGFIEIYWNSEEKED